MDAQRTIKRQISCAGIGLHSGQKVTLTLKPAGISSGAAAALALRVAEGLEQGVVVTLFPDACYKT